MGHVSEPIEQLVRLPTIQPGGPILPARPWHVGSDARIDLQRRHDPDPRCKLHEPACLSASTGPSWHELLWLFRIAHHRTPDEQRVRSAQPGHAKLPVELRRRLWRNCLALPTNPPRFPILCSAVPAKL